MRTNYGVTAIHAHAASSAVHNNAIKMMAGQDDARTMVVAFGIAAHRDEPAAARHTRNRDLSGVRVACER